MRAYFGFPLEVSMKALLIGFSFLTAFGLVSANASEIEVDVAESELATNVTYFKPEALDEDGKLPVQFRLKFSSQCEADQAQVRLRVLRERGAATLVERPLRLAVELSKGGDVACAEGEPVEVSYSAKVDKLQLAFPVLYKVGLINPTTGQAAQKWIVFVRP